jgi:hypothetical protein
MEEYAENSTGDETLEDMSVTMQRACEVSAVFENKSSSEHRPTIPDQVRDFRTAVCAAVGAEEKHLAIKALNHAQKHFKKRQATDKFLIFSLCAPRNDTMLSKDFRLLLIDDVLTFEATKWEQ